MHAGKGPGNPPPRQSSFANASEGPVVGPVPRSAVSAKSPISHRSGYVSFVRSWSQRPLTYLKTAIGTVLPSAMPLRIADLAALPAAALTPEGSKRAVRPH